MKQTLVFFFIIVILCSSLNGKTPSEDEIYHKLSPGAFFSMKDNDAKGPGLGPMGPAGPGMGPMGPGLGPMGPGMGPAGPGMGPMGPSMGPMGPSMGPMGPSMGPMGPGMEPMGHGMGPMGSPGPIMGPKGPIGPMKPGITDMREGKKGYEHFDLSILDDMVRTTNYAENFAIFPKMDPKMFGKEQNVYDLLYNLCFCLSYIWRRGRQSIRKYYHLRDIYSNHLAFEVGYITHVIMTKYQNMLELYEYCNTKVPKKKGGPSNITRMHLTHFQYSIEQDSQQIQYLCDMLNELKKKYSIEPYDPRNKFDIPPPGWVSTEASTTTETTEPEWSDHLRVQGGRTGQPTKPKAYLAQKIEETHKLIDAALAGKKRKLQNAREYFKKHGHYPTTTKPRTLQPMRLWSPNLDYGWSGEDEW
ncbi:uncharacterized protein LOC133532686 isoform X1 [Cydia pomonella]|uniref:uncharacterized protein LOC133532686 isoform X1 n=1 Tax=Cydia pomonella TaxID=82600 RepID=UPI002ADE6E56|nr:uncharacterized protein LOC133532686 isoform X1 [Cydia pomonella]